MADLDALLGPKVDKDKARGLGIITIGANNPTMTRQDVAAFVLPAPPKEKEEAEPVTVPQRRVVETVQQKLSVSVRKESEDQKANRLAFKKRIREEEEEKKRQQLSEVERERQSKLDAELLEGALFVEQLHAAKKRYEAEKMIKVDGSEIPSTFAVSDHRSFVPDESNTEAVAADEARAARLDAVIPVTEFYSQDAFPTGVLVHLATQNGRAQLNQCEIAFVINGHMVRKNRFADEEQLRRFITTKRPERIELGPQYPDENPANEHHTKLNLRRYLVFDVDFDSTHHVRTCPCKDKKATCSTGCWFYMRVAVKVLTYLMRRCFGAKYIIPVFSGRRGVHLWCLDEQFLDCSAEDRKGFLSRLELYGKPAVYTHPEHTTYIYDFIMRDEFNAHFIGTDAPLILAPEAMLFIIRCMGVEGNLASNMPPLLSEKIGLLYRAENYEQRLSAWHDVCSAVDTEKEWVPGTYERLFVFAVMYPRLDREVTTTMNHLLKAMFVIHPETKRCSVPIPDIETWRPDMAPRISELAAVPVKDPHTNKGPQWMQDKEARAREAVLTKYVLHVWKMVSEAYPLQSRNPFKR